MMNTNSAMTWLKDLINNNQIYLKYKKPINNFINKIKRKAVYRFSDGMIWSRQFAGQLCSGAEITLGFFYFNQSSGIDLW